MNKKEDFGTILQKEQMQFKDNKELEKYYHNKWDTEGYTKGYTLFGVDVSGMYQEARQAAAFRNLDPQKEDIILDAGCGKGELSVRAAKECKKVYAIDLAKTAFKENNTNPPKNLIFKKMNVEKLKFQDKSFDKIICIETIEHVLHPDTVIQEFYRVLKPQGILVISYPFPNKTTIGMFEIALKIRKNFTISEHLNEWGYDEALEHFTKSGFELVRAKGVILDVGILFQLRKISRFLTIKITKLLSKENNCPRNSGCTMFVLKKL